MIELILAMAVILLWASHIQIARRLRALEERLGESTATESPPVERHVPIAAPVPEQPVYADAQPREEEVESASVPVRETLAGLFERVVGGNLLVWMGGIALAVAGFFLIRYSIEIGLVTPGVRMIMGAVFGVALVLAGERARSDRRFSDDARTAQALVGAGIAVLYATTYGSLTLYGLIGMTTAFMLMAAVTAAALVLSLRHGVPTAVMGLIGGFATPLVIGDEATSAAPLLAYLGLLNAALFALALRRGWLWLAAGATLLSFGWTALLLAAPNPADAIAAGLFVVALSVAASLVRPSGGRDWLILLPAGFGLLQLGALLMRIDIGPAAWALFGVLSLACLILAARRSEFRWIALGALLLTLLLLAVKALIDEDPLLPHAAVAATLLFGLFAYWKRKGAADRLLWTAIACMGTLGPVLILRAGDPELLGRTQWGLIMAALAIGPAFLAWAEGRRKSGSPALRLPLFWASAAAALLLIFAAVDLFAAPWLPAIWALIGIGLALFARRVEAPSLSLLVIAIIALAGLTMVAAVPELWFAVIGSLAGVPALASDLPSPANAFRWLIVPVPLAALALHWMPVSYPRLEKAMSVLAAVLLVAGLYVFAKQVFALRDGEDFVARGFAERLVITQLLFAGGWLLASGRIRTRWAEQGRLRAAGIALTALAAARVLWLDIFIYNPALVTQWVGGLPVLNLLLPAYMGSALWLYLAWRRAEGREAKSLWLFSFLASLLAGAMLLVRQVFQGAILTAERMGSAEFYCYSLAGLLLSIGLLLAGVKLRDGPLRVAGLALLTATIVKVFIVDAAALEGVLRILSFLGLGIALIGISKLYKTVLRTSSGERDGLTA